MRLSNSNDPVDRTADALASFCFAIAILDAIYIVVDAIRRF